MKISETENTIPPRNIEAEKCILGACIQYQDTAPEITLRLTSQDFWLPRHQKIFAAIVDLMSRGLPPDLPSFAEFYPESSSGISSDMLSSIADDYGFTKYIRHHVEFVLQSSAKRRAIHWARNFIDELSESHEDYDTIWARCLPELPRLDSKANRHVYRLDESIKDSLREIEQAYSQQKPLGGIPLGLAEFERGHGIFCRTNLLTLGAQTGDGKTALALGVAKHVAAQGRSVIFVTAEMTSAELTKRLLSSESGIENIRLHKGILRESEFPILAASAGRLNGYQIYFVENLVSWERVKAEVRRIKWMDAKVALVCIDYAQLMRAPSAERLRYLEVSRVSAESKALAGELDVGVILLSQLNRDGGLRESDSLKHDSDIVWILSRENEEAVIRIEKNRNGRCGGTLHLEFNEATVSFVEAA